MVNHLTLQRLKYERNVLLLTIFRRYTMYFTLHIDYGPIYWLNFSKLLYTSSNRANKQITKELTLAQEKNSKRKSLRRVYRHMSHSSSKLVVNKPCCQKFDHASINVVNTVVK